MQHNLKESQHKHISESYHKKLESGANFTYVNIINYYLSSFHATSHGEIHNLHAVVIDKNKENHPQRTCQKLAIELATMFAAVSKYS